MTIAGKCSIAVSILFWQIVSFGVFGYAFAFLFYPHRVIELFERPLPENVIRYIGSLFLLADAGLNQMVESSTFTTGVFVKRIAFTTTVFLYILAGTSGLVVVSLNNPSVFKETQTLVFQILYSLFIGFLSLNLLGVCSGYYRFKAGADVQNLESIELSSSTKPNGIKSTLSREDIRAGRR
jgi:hypothetical protein